MVWCSCSALVSINEVNRRRAWLVLGWVTVSGFSFRCGTFISVCDQPPRSTQPGRPFLSRCQRAVRRVWVAGKTVRSHCYTRAISERFRNKGLIIKRYINSSVYFYRRSRDFRCGVALILSFGVLKGWAWQGLSSLPRKFMSFFVWKWHISVHFYAWCV